MLTRIDDLTCDLYPFLTADDECYYLREYTSGQGFEYSHTNSLISNLRSLATVAVSESGSINNQRSRRSHKNLPQVSTFTSFESRHLSQYRRRRAKAIRCTMIECCKSCNGSIPMAGSIFVSFCYSEKP